MEKIRQYFKERQFVFRVFIIVFAFLILLVILMNIISFHFLNNFLMEEIDSLMYSNLSDLDMSLSHYIHQYQKTSQTIYNMPKMQSFILNEDNPIVNHIEVASLLQPFLTVHSNVDSVFLFKGEDIILERDARYQALAFKEEMVRQILETTSDIAMLRVQAPQGEGHGYRLVVFSSHRPHLMAPPEYGVAMVINPYQLANTILPKESESFDGFLIVTHGSKPQILLQRFYHPTGSSVLPLLAQENPPNAQLHYQSQVTNPSQGSFFLSQLYNPEQNYTVYSLADYDATFAKVRSTRTVINLLFISLSVVAFFVSITIANRINRPINRMLSEIWTSFGAPLGDNYSGSFVDASLSITSTAHRVKELEQKRQEERFFQFLEGELTELPTELLRMESTFFQGPKGASYEIILGQSLYPFSVLDKEGIRQAVQECFSLQDRPQEHFLFFPEKTQFALLCEAGFSLGELQALLFQKEVPLLGIAQTRPSTDLQQVPKFLQEALELLRHQVFRPQEFLFPYTITTQLPAGETMATLSEEAIHLVQSSETSAIPHYVTQVFHALRLAPYDDGILILANLITDIENSLMHMTVDSQEYQAFFVNHYLSLRSANQHDELVFRLSHVINETCLAFEIAKSHTMQDTLQKALDYIDSEYKNYNLSVDWVAQQVHISPSYFSKIFNSFTNSSFPEYLNNLRLEKAADILLQSPEIKIKTVAKQVGFSSSSYFSSAFRKKYGLSPSQYRKNYKNTP